MIFTSYFDKIKKFPKNVIPIAICAKVPEWYTGLRYPKLAPKYDALMKYKGDHNEADYIECFNNTTLDELDIVTVLAELQIRLDIFYGIKLDGAILDDPDWHIALICYEKPSDFCHRHLVAEWFRKYGIDCREGDLA